MKELPPDESAGLAQLTLPPNTFVVNLGGEAVSERREGQ